MKTRIVLLGALLTCASGGATAAADPEVLLKQDIDRHEQELRERRWDERHSPGGTPVLPPAPAAAGGPCFAVRQITLHPGDVLPARRVAQVVAAYEGRCLGAADLAALQHALNSLALETGLVTTRVVVPEQNLASGELRLEIWPGVLEGQEAPALSPRELALASPLRAGERLQLRALEQAVDNLNRLASFHSSIDLKPGAQPGGSVALFTVQRTRPWQAALAWQGAALNGEETHTLRASATADSPLRLADRLVLGVNGNLQDGQVDDSHGGSVDYDLPVGWWRLSAGADRYDYQNVVHAGLTAFTATGESRAWRVEAARLLSRDAKARWTLALHGKRRLNDNFIDGVTVGVSTTRIDVAGLRLDFSRVAAPWVWDASLDAEDGAGRSRALYSPIDAHYVRLQGNSRLQYYFGAASVSARVSGQWSDARLAPSEQFTLTGYVQGFSPLAINADNGVAVQIELARPVMLQRAGLTTLRPSLGLAWALAPHAGGNPGKEEIAALTTGLALPWRRALANVGLAFPVAALNTRDAPQDWQLDASVSLQW